MEGVRNWVFTICGGALICGIVSALVPGKSFEKAIQLLLGVFMLFCFLTPLRLDISLPTVDIAAAEQRRLAVAGDTEQQTQSQLMQDIADRATTETATILAEYEVEQGECRLTVAQGSSGEVVVQLELPERVAEATQGAIASRLQQQLGVAVTVRKD